MRKVTTTKGTDKVKNKTKLAERLKKRYKVSKIYRGKRRWTEK